MSRTHEDSFCGRNAIKIVFMLAALVFLAGTAMAQTMTCTPVGGVDLEHELDIGSSGIVSCSIVSVGDPICSYWYNIGTTLSGCGASDTTCVFNAIPIGHYNPSRFGQYKFQGGSCSYYPGYEVFNAFGGYYASYGSTLPDTALFDPTTGQIIAGYRYVRDTHVPANSGLQDYTGHWVGTSFTNTFAKNGNDNTSIDLTNIDTGVVYATMYTGSSNSGTVTWDGTSALLNSGAPYGRYVSQIRGTSIISNILYFQPAGSYIWFGSHTYSDTDTPVINWVIDPAYYSPTTYSYDWNVTDVYGTPITRSDISAASGSATFKFPTGTTQGVKFLYLEATPKAGSMQIWGIDYTTVNSNVRFHGFVTDHNDTPLSGAIVNFTQGLTTQTLVSGFDGNYTSTATFTPSSVMTFNVTKSGYRQWYVSTIPLAASSVNLNFTLPANGAVSLGLGIGGIVYEGSIVNGVLSKGYGNPISGVTSHITNTSTGEDYIATSNGAGWYQADAKESITLTAGRPYNVSGSKPGYSTIYYEVIPE